MIGAAACAAGTMFLMLRRHDSSGWWLAWPVMGIAAVASFVQRWMLTRREHPSAVTFSAGITDLDGPDALRIADEALYLAKAAGRDQVAVLC